MTLLQRACFVACILLCAAAEYDFDKEYYRRYFKKQKEERKRLSTYDPGSHPAAELAF